MVTVMEGLDQQPAGFLRGLQHLRGLGGIHSKWLFAQNSFPRMKRGDAHVRMATGRQGIVDEINVRALHKRLILRLNSCNPMLRCKSLPARLIAAGDRRDLTVDAP